MTQLRTIYSTVEGLPVTVKYYYHEEIPVNLTGAPEDCYPDEPEDIEICSILLDGYELAAIADDDIIKGIKKDILNYEHKESLCR